MPQFVVTLTGLDSKLYSQEDVDDLNTNFNDEFMDTSKPTSYIILHRNNCSISV